MEKKYYDLIIKLIKEHRKFSGLEAILEDIADDVYEHSKVVIGSITNEEVITAYLNKVVAVSIVTVPKKLNFNVKARHRIITTLIPTVTEAPPVTQIEPETPAVTEEIPTQEEVLPLEELLETEKISETIVSDENEIDMEVVEEVDVKLPNPVIEEAEKAEETSESENYDLSELFDESNTLDNLLDVEQVDTEDLAIVEEQVEAVEQTSSVNKNLVDMMINGVPTSEVEEEETADIIETTDEFSNEIYEELDNIETLEETCEELFEAPAEAENLIGEDIIELTEELEVEENSIEDSFEQSDQSELEAVVELAETLEEDILETAEESFEEEEKEEEILSIVEDEADSTLLLDNEYTATEELEPIAEENEADLMVHNSENNEPAFDIGDVAEATELETEDIIEEASDLELFEDSNEEMLLEEDNATFELEAVDEAESLIESGDVESNELRGDSSEDTEEEIVSNNTADFDVPSFECFDYEPEKPDYDSQEILSYLIDIDEKHPERKILTICNLKYTQGLSVTEISEKVDFTEEEVLDVLNEIIDTVKD